MISWAPVTPYLIKGGIITPCYHPLKGFIIGIKSDGKKDIKVRPYAVDHIYLFRGSWHDSYDFDRFRYAERTVREYIDIPCGHCTGCLIERSKQWANRCVMEMDYCDSAYFLTLTYNEEHLPVGYGADPETGEAIPHATLRKRDFQLFMKRLRKAFPNDHIRYLACGEYGSKTHRPHYHAIVFGLHLDDLRLLRHVDDKGQYDYFTSFSLQNVWSVLQYSQGEGTSPWRSALGYVMVGKVNWKTCAYVARYTLKKHYGKDAELYSKLGIEPEFILMSRKPGLGAQWFADHPDCMNYDFINLSLGVDGAKKIRPPKYFDRLLELEAPEQLAGLKASRQQFSKERKKVIMSQTDLSYTDYLLVQERNLLSRIKALKREL